MAQQLEQETLNAVEVLKQEEIISEKKDRSLPMKEVSTLPVGDVIINCDEDNKPLEVISSNKVSLFGSRFSTIFAIGAPNGAALLEHGKSRFVAWNKFSPGLFRVKSREEDEPVLTYVPNSAFAPSIEWFASADEKEIKDYISKIFDFASAEKKMVQFISAFNSVRELKHEKKLPTQTWGVQVPEYYPIESFGEYKHKPVIFEPMVLVRRESHKIDMPLYADYASLLARHLKEKQADYNLQGKIAMVCTGVSAQNILSLVGGSSAMMNIPEPIFYSAVVANATAFLSSSIALLLLKKKPYASWFFEGVGFASAIATFMLMMSAFLPSK